MPNTRHLSLYTALWTTFLDRLVIAVLPVVFWYGCTDTALDYGTTGSTVRKKWLSPCLLFDRNFNMYRVKVLPVGTSSSAVHEEDFNYHENQLKKDLFTVVTFSLWRLGILTPR